MVTEALEDRGWCLFPAEKAVADWVSHAKVAAAEALLDPSHAAQYQCGGTWFVGLEALPNDPIGRLAGGPALAGKALEFAANQSRGLPVLHAAQLSVIRPGYPKPRTGESEAAFGYRLRRDAAHVDGVLGVGTPKRRYLKEAHGFVLGLPLSHSSADAAPLVVWEGSHEIMRAAFCDALQGHYPETWGDVDVTEPYVAARKRCFEECARVTVHAEPGAAYVVHRLALHGVAPWSATAHADPLGRMVAYFRPDLPGGLPDWLELP